MSIEIDEVLAELKGWFQQYHPATPDDIQDEVIRDYWRILQGVPFGSEVIIRRDALSGEFRVAVQLPGGE